VTLYESALCLVMPDQDIFQNIVHVQSNSALPKRFSTATQLLERQSIATHVALLDRKKVVLKRKKMYLLFNIILQKTRFISHNEACVIGALVSGYC
jgi:hypothetical protein